MAEKKFGDIMLGIFFGIFFLGAFSSIIISFDNEVTGSVIGGKIQGVYNDSVTGSQDMEISLYQDTYNTSVFSIPSDSDVDPRGTSQIIETTRSSPSTIRTFLNSVGKIIPIHWTILALITSVVVSIGFILLIRFFRPGGA